MQARAARSRGRSDRDWPSPRRAARIEERRRSSLRIDLGLLPLCSKVRELGFQTFSLGAVFVGGIGAIAEEGDLVLQEPGAIALELSSPRFAFPPYRVAFRSHAC